MGVTEQKPLLHLDANGNSYYGGEFTNITSATANGQLAQGPVYVHRVNVTIAGTAGTFTLYDGTDITGAKIGAWDATKTDSYEVCAHCKVGLYLAVSGLAGSIDAHVVHSDRNLPQ